jgi:hypothetical protein
MPTLEFDATTGLRFHPVEILLSMVIKIAAVVLLGAAAVAVLIFEVLLNATAMWSHSNLRLPATIDRLLRHLFVTPDMHRSTIQSCREKRTATSASIWRCGTSCSAPTATSPRQGTRE